MKKLLNQIKKDREYIEIDRLLNNITLEIDGMVHDYNFNDIGVFWRIDGINVITSAYNFNIFFNGYDLNIVKERIKIYFDLSGHEWSPLEH